MTLNVLTLTPRAVSYTISVKDFGAVGDGVTDDTAAIQAAFDATGSCILFPSGTYLVSDTITVDKSRLKVSAYGAKVITSANKLIFDFNSDADPTSTVTIESSSKSYVYWEGGEITSSIEDPTAVVAFKAYAVRQLTMRDVIIGTSSGVYVKYGVQLAGLGGHLFENNRFLKPDIAFYCPDWSGGLTGAGVPISTSHFIANQFTLATSQQAIYVDGGFNRWKIWGGFVNGSAGGNGVFYFSNRKSANQLEFKGIGMEQGVASSNWIYLEDIAAGDSETMQQVRIDSCNFEGNPAGGSLTAVNAEKVTHMDVTNCRFEQNPATSNVTIALDADCEEVEVSRSCKFSYDDSVTAACSRTQITMHPCLSRLTFKTLTGYNGDAFSSGTATLDMSSLMGADYPSQLAPLAYNLMVQARDSASGASTTARVEVGRNLTDAVTTRAIVDLRGVDDDKRVSENIYMPCDSNGDIAIQVFATGTDTVDLWIYVIATHN